jgi:hypothetical protein
MPFTGWFRLQRQQRACTRSRPAGPGKHSFFFETFRRTASACAIVKAFRGKKRLFPRRLKKGPNKGDLVWAELPHSRALHILHNPRTPAHSDMAEAVRATTRTEASPIPGCRASSGRCSTNGHPCYISWEQYEENFLRLREKRASCRSRSSQESSTRGACLVARFGGLWRLWEPNDGPIPHASGPPSA